MLPKIKLHYYILKNVLITEKKKKSYLDSQEAIKQGLKVQDARAGFMPKVWNCKEISLIYEKAFFATTIKWERQSNDYCAINTHTQEKKKTMKIKGT